MVCSRVDWSKLAVVAAVVAALTLGVIAQYLLVEREDVSWGLIFWGLALAIFLVGIWQGMRVAADTLALGDEADVQGGAIGPRTEVVLFLAVIAVGIFFRLYRLDSIPPGLNHDAAWNGLHAIRITNGLDFAPYVAEAWGRETMFHYMVALSQLLFGQTQFAIQITAVTIGIATLGAFYLLMRRLFDTRLALIATFFLSISGWHLTFGRVGWRTILVPLFVALVFYFLTKALEERRMRDFVLAGVALGLSLYTYDAARVLPFAAAALIVYELLRTPSFIRTHFLHLGAFAAAFLASFAPLGWYALNHWDEFTRRGSFLWIGNKIEDAGSLEPLFANVKDALLMYNFRAGGADFFVKEPLLDLPISVFFTLGLILALLRVRQRSYFLLLAVLAFSLAVGISSSPNGNRAIGTILPVTAFAAVFLYEAWRWLRQAFPRYEQLFSLILVSVLLLTAYSIFHSYLGPNRRTQFGFFPETSVVGRYIHDAAGENMVYAAAGDWAADTLTYLSYQGDGNPFVLEYRYTKVARELLTFQPASDRGTVFIIKDHPAGTEVFDILRGRFPSATSDQIYLDDDAVTLIANVVQVPPGGGDGADFSAYVEPGAEERDATRRQDLSDIAAVLADYENRTGLLPTTDGSADVGCAYTALGQLCVFIGQLDPDTLADPRGRALRYGYWYESDGSSFTIYASLEIPLAPEEACITTDAFLALEPNLFCIRG
ncbi:MAG: glycosyltransferase family 39 protein [Chloroflexi bacterium]|nr:glycosyltransferase family 39 protein [Chloroflexota bacterium]